MTVHVHRVRVFYEHTDHSGFVYHPRYLSWCEQAREYMLGLDELVRLWRDDGVGFVVYRIDDFVYRDAARFGDDLEVRTTVEAASEWRLVFDHRIVRPPDDRSLVQGRVELACVDRTGALVRVPTSVLDAIEAQA